MFFIDVFWKTSGKNFEKKVISSSENLVVKVYFYELCTVKQG